MQIVCANMNYDMIQSTPQLTRMFNDTKARKKDHLFLTNSKSKRRTEA